MATLAAKRANANISDAARSCRRRFLRFFPRGFSDPKYFEWERGYKLAAFEQWQEVLHQEAFAELLKSGEYEEIARRAVRIESKTNLLFSFEKMALRDAVREPAGSRIFAEGLFDLLHGPGEDGVRFESWCHAVGRLPRTQTRVLTHPVVTVFPFIAAPQKHIFLKPNLTKTAARKYGFDFEYRSTPSWPVYSQLLDFAARVKRDLRDLNPADMIDIQSFLWVIASDEYRHMSA